MEVAFEDEHLDDIETGKATKSRFQAPVIRAFRKLINLIRQCEDERDLYNYPGARLEKLKGKRSHQSSLRLNDQWRLIIEIRKGNPKNVIHVVAIEDYH